MGQNYGYETLMTLLPTFMKQILHFDIKSVKKPGNWTGVATIVNTSAKSKLVVETINIA